MSNPFELANNIQPAMAGFNKGGVAKGCLTISLAPFAFREFQISEERIFFTHSLRETTSDLSDRIIGRVASTVVMDSESSHKIAISGFASG